MNKLHKALATYKQAIALQRAKIRRGNIFIKEQFVVAVQKESKWSTLTVEQQMLALKIIDEECMRQLDYSVKEIIKLGGVLKKRLTQEVEHNEDY